MAVDRPLDTNGFAQRGRAKRLPERAFGHDTDPPPKQVLEAFFKPSEIQQRPPRLKRNEEVDIADVRVVPACYRSEDAHVTCSISGGGGVDHIP